MKEKNAQVVQLWQLRCPSLRIDDFLVGEQTTDLIVDLCPHPIDVFGVFI
jgi:hypothetical protein